MPGRGRNPDLEAERLTGAPLARPYSEHDDRRGGDGPPQGRRRNPSPMAWRHDMFDAVVKSNPKGNGKGEDNPQANS